MIVDKDSKPAKVPYPVKVSLYSTNSTILSVQSIITVDIEKWYTLVPIKSCDTLPPLKGCGLPASANTRWILRQAFIRLCPSLFRICTNPASALRVAGVCRSSLSRRFAYGSAVNSSMTKTAFKLFAFIPPLKGVGIPAHLLLILREHKDT